MKFIKKITVFLLCLALLGAFASCDKQTGNTEDGKPEQTTTVENSDNKEPPKSPDGLSADKTYYQLTDKNGVLTKETL